jgi:hypothetical protein
LNSLELQLNFLEGNIINLEPNLKIHKVSFSDINKNIGYLKYNQIINTLCFSDSDVSKFTTKQDMDVYSFIFLYAYQSMQEKINNNNLNENYFIDDLIAVLELIFQDTVYLDLEYECFCIGNYGFLYRDNFDEFQDIIKQRNCLENIEEEKDNPANEMARQILEKRKKAREKLAKIKAKENGDESPLTIFDLISIFSEAEHMKPEEVFRYDIFQFNDQFNRMKIFKDYSVNIQALLAGAKSEDIDLQHWLSKIKIK